MQGDHVVIADWPVQFLRAGTPLLQEALATAIEKDVEGTQVRVLTSEHIAAVALETDRAKDKTRVLQFIEADTVDVERLKGILGAPRFKWPLGAIRATIPQITSDEDRAASAKQTQVPPKTRECAHRRKAANVRRAPPAGSRYSARVGIESNSEIQRSGNFSEVILIFN
jgi:hypothetical protein